VYFTQDAEDATLVAQSVQGDAAGFATLVERYQRVLYTVAYRMLGNPDDARDAVQASFLKAFERLATFNPEHKFFSWMYRIVMNECLNLIRDRHPEEAPCTERSSGSTSEDDVGRAWLQKPGRGHTRQYYEAAVSADYAKVPW